MRLAVDAEELARRLVAARALTPRNDEEEAKLQEQLAVGGRHPGYGIDRAELAARIVRFKTVSGATIGKWERAQVVPDRSALWAVAEACDLPLDFFYVDFERLRGLAEAEPRWRAGVVDLRRQAIESTPSEALGTDNGQERRRGDARANG